MIPKTSNLLAAFAFVAAAVLPAAAHALPAVQRGSDAVALPAVQGGWWMSLYAQWLMAFGG